MKTKNLKLNAISEEDLKIISAHLQDAITQVKHIAFLKKIEYSLSNLTDLCGKMLKKEFLEKAKGFNPY